MPSSGVQTCADRKSTRLNSSHTIISYAVFCLKKNRRERRVFTLQDDPEILDGLEKYGPAWTKSQRAPQYNFKSRQPFFFKERGPHKYPHFSPTSHSAH